MCPPGSERRSHSNLLLFGGALVAVLWVYRDFLFSGATWIAGDTGDTRGFIGTLEHWLNVIRYGVSIRSEPFFYPDAGVMGYNESLLLYVPFYAVFRSLHLDQFLAFQWVLISLTAISSVSVHFVLNRGLGFAPWISFCGSLLFTCSAMTYLVMSHGVLLSVAVLPVLLSIAVAALDARRLRRVRRARIYLALAGLLLGLEAATCFYIFWSIVFVACLFGLCLLMLLALFDRASLRMAAQQAVSWWPEMAAGGFGLAVGLIPFLWIYLPIVRYLGGGHPVEAAYQFMADWRDVVNVGTRDLVWGKLVQWFCLDHSVERWFGWTPGLIVAACCGGVAALWRLHSAASKRLCDALAGSAALTWIVSFCLFVKMGPLRLWKLVYVLVPGASGIRVPQRGDLVSNFLVCLAAAYFLNWLSTREWLRSLLPGPRAAVLGAVSLFLLVEQVNTAPTHRLDRPTELARMARIANPPRGCGVFYVSKAAYAGQPTAATQLDAVLTAVRFRLPTVNGRGTVLPEDWNIEDLAEPNYESRANARALRVSLTGELCTLDLETGAWQRADVLNPAHKTLYRTGTLLDFGSGGDAGRYETTGWSTAEETGTWMVGKGASLEFFLEPAPQHNLVLQMEGLPFSPPQGPNGQMQVLANGVQVAEAGNERGPVRIETPIGLETLRGHSRLEIAVKNLNGELLSPKQYGLSADSRHMFFYLRTLRITETGLPEEPCSVNFRGWFPQEKLGPDWWRWSSGRSQLGISVSEDRDVVIDGLLSSIQTPNTIGISFDGRKEAEVEVPAAELVPLHALRLHLSKGEHVIEFVSRNAGKPLPTDSRALAIALRNLRVQTAGGCTLQ